MAIESYCTSGWDLPLKKRRRIIAEANPPPMMISKLGDDLLIEILIRSFPNPKSACRCKAVCKRWCSLISSPCFNRRFVSHHQNMNQQRTPGNPNELQSFILGSLPPIPNRVGDTLQVLDCFKDLVLCGAWDLDTDNGEASRSYLICNPFTKQWVALPLDSKKSPGYVAPVSRLVCEPRTCNNFDLGDGPPFVYSEYRFRVVCMYQKAVPLFIKLDVFCSESGEWAKEALVHVDEIGIACKSVSSCLGEMVWMYYAPRDDSSKHLLAVFNPFRLDSAPTCIDPSAFFGESIWLISVSQGALHVISYHKRKPLRLIVWRLEEDRKSWRKECEGLVKKKCKCCGYEPEDCFLPFLHPYNPEIVFFNCIACKSALLSCNLLSEELELVAKLEGKQAHFLVKVLEPRVFCWPTLIPNYEELRSMYAASYNFWVQNSREGTTPSIVGR